MGKHSLPGQDLLPKSHGKGSWLTAKWESNMKQSAGMLEKTLISQNTAEDTEHTKKGVLQGFPCSPN